MSRATKESLDIERLPSVIAIPIDRWIGEEHEEQRLWRICDAVEVFIRFIVAILLAELRRTGGIPADVAVVLRDRIQTPSLGAWSGFAAAAQRAIGERNVEVPAIVRDAIRAYAERIRPLLKPASGGSDAPEVSLEALRNLLAHAGGLGRKGAGDYLDRHGHEERALAMFQSQRAWLTEARLVYVEEKGRYHALRGPSVEAVEVAIAGAATRTLDECRHGLALLSPDGIALDLAPLCGVDVRRSPPSDSHHAPTPLVYIRKHDALKLLYAALGGDPPLSHRGEDHLGALRALYAAAAAAAVGESPVTSGDAPTMIGRREELGTLLGKLKETPSGVLWLTGAAGIGKSVLMAAAAASEQLNDARKSLVIAHRFKVGDASCSRRAFLELACRRLREWGELDVDSARVQEASASDTALEGALEGLLRRVAALRPRSQHPLARAPRVVFMVDGIDEIARIDPGFPDLPFRFADTNVVWLCAGRPEPALQERFSESRGVVHVFPAEASPVGGLRPMPTADIREMLLEALADKRYGLLERDREGADGKVSNDLVTAIAERAAGLPQYVRLVIADLLDGSTTVDAALGDLPPSVAAYHDTLMQRHGADDLGRAVGSTLATIAVAHAPLDDDALFAILLALGDVFDDEEGHALAMRARESLSSVLSPARTLDGRLGWSCYHATLRAAVLEPTSRMRMSVTRVRRALSDAAARWEQRAYAPLRSTLLRDGAKYAIEAGHRDRAEELMTSFARTVALFDAFGARGVSIWLGDVARFPREGRGAALAEWVTFVRRSAHILRRGDDGWPASRILVQLAVEHARASDALKEGGLGASALEWVRATRPSWPIVQNRVPVQRGRRRIVRMEGHPTGEMTHFGVDVLSRDRALSWGSDGTARIWSLLDGEELARFSHGREEVRGALALADGRFLTWTVNGAARIWSVEMPHRAVTLVEEDIRAAFQLADHRIVCAGATRVTIWTPDGRDVAEPATLSADIVGAAPLDETRFLTWSEDGTVRLWSPAPSVVDDGALKWCTPAIRNGEAIWCSAGGATYLNKTGRASKVLAGEVTSALLLDGGHALCGVRGRFVVVELHTGRVVAERRGDWEGAKELWNGEVVLWEGRGLAFWDWRSESVDEMLASDRAPYGDANISVGYHLLYSADETLAVIDPSRREHRCLLREDGVVLGAREVNQRLVLSWASDGALSLWFVGPTGQQSARDDEEWTDGAIVLADDRVLTWSVSNGSRGPRLWRPTGEPLGPVPGWRGGVDSVTELVDGRVAIARGGRLCLYASDLESHRELREAGRPGQTPTWIDPISGRSLREELWTVDGDRLGGEVPSGHRGSDEEMESELLDPVMTLMRDGITVRRGPSGKTLEITSSSGARAVWHGETELNLHALTRAKTAVVSFGFSLAFVDVRLDA